MQASPIDVLDHTAKNYATAHAVLAERVQRHEEEVAAITRRLLPGIKSAAMQAAQAEAELRRHIETHPELFEKPRTMTLHGVKLGLQKGKGEITFTNAARTVEKIKEHFGDEADIYLITKETPARTALMSLDAGTLRKLGCTLEETGDQVVIKAAATDIDKIVAKLLNEAAKATGEDAA